MNKEKIETRLASLYGMLERIQIKLFDETHSEMVKEKLEIMEAQLLNRIEALEDVLDEYK